MSNWTFLYIIPKPLEMGMQTWTVVSLSLSWLNWWIWSLPEQSHHSTETQNLKTMLRGFLSGNFKSYIRYQISDIDIIYHTSLKTKISPHPGLPERLSEWWPENLFSFVQFVTAANLFYQPTFGRNRIQEANKMPLSDSLIDFWFLNPNEFGRQCSLCPRCSSNVPPIQNLFPATFPWICSWNLAFSSKFTPNKVTLR